MATTTNAPGNVNTGYQINGITSLVWGTGNAMGSYIVVSVDESQKTEQYYVENGTGIEAARILLTHGTRWNVTVIDDSAITPPVVGGTVTIWTHSTGNSASATATAMVISNDVRAARKTESQRVLQVENLTLVNP
jgi:hypothetical protein